MDAHGPALTRWMLAMSPAALALVTAVAQAGTPAGHRPAPGDDPSPFVELLVDRPLHFSHRGGAESWPENTLYAFTQAVVQAQTDVLELDLHLSADGIPVVIHDFTVDDTTNGHGAVRQKTVAALQELDAGHDFTYDGDTFPYRGQGLTIPTLEEVFQALTDGTIPARPWLNLELKVPDPALEAAVTDLIEVYGLEERVCVGSAFGTTGRHLKAELPGTCVWYPVTASLCLGLDTVVDPSLEGCPDFDVLEAPADLLQTPFGAQVINYGVERGIPVVAWVVDDPEEMEALFELGVSGIMTDLPMELRRVMTTLGYPPLGASGY